MTSKIWFITGISSGLGKALAETVIQKGDFVIGTFRQQRQVDDFNAKHSEKALGVLLDVRDFDAIKSTFEIIEKRFGRLDVLVNNAGFGVAGAVEETSEEEVRQVFEANFFAALEVTKGALPLMRRQGSGHILQISSHGGFKAFAGFGIYNASKFALEGFSEALAAEVLPLGINLTIVEPGPYRTGFAGNAFRLAQDYIPDYKGTAGVFREKIKAVDGKQEGDPQKAAEAILGITQTETPPLRLPLGKVAVGTLMAKLQNVQHDLDQYRLLAESAVF
ncbi:SDR family NAD(P)-dependent oxidoreductase [Fulvivirga sp. M361]|uniref:oxidoreductase n=1 Tax=Fulvivirga sp. M361 TaxID=2594266 RepID=UPI00117B01EC|nr:oxidoreductase [Fulvivirga sp. M361]TRX62695.1 SDR family NAD(P)-dependent oxidoreductase [Fulvivirga sp. M361]